MITMLPSKVYMIQRRMGSNGFVTQPELGAFTTMGLVSDKVLNLVEKEVESMATVSETVANNRKMYLEVVRCDFKIIEIELIQKGGEK